MIYRSVLFRNCLKQAVAEVAEKLRQRHIGIRIGGSVRINGFFDQLVELTDDVLVLAMRDHTTQFFIKLFVTD